MKRYYWVTYWRYDVHWAPYGVAIDEDPIRWFVAESEHEMHRGKPLRLVSWQEISKEQYRFASENL